MTQTTESAPSDTLKAMLAAEHYQRGVCYFRSAEAINEPDEPPNGKGPRSANERQADQAAREAARGYGRVYCKAPMDEQSKAAVSSVGQALIADRAAGNDLFLRAIQAALADPSSVLLAEKIAKLRGIRRCAVHIIVGEPPAPPGAFSTAFESSATA
jgi:hypothetical protein